MTVAALIVGLSSSRLSQIDLSVLARWTIIPQLLGAHSGSPSRQALAPRFAASYKIVMSMAMGYMLLMML